jgi:pyruvate dehydrogenase E1 component
LCRQISVGQYEVTRGEGADRKYEIGFGSLAYSIAEEYFGETMLSAEPNQLCDCNAIEDSDPAETQDWMEALDDVLRSKGVTHCAGLVRRVLEHAWLRGMRVRAPLNTPYCNTIERAAEPVYPGDLELERQITAIVRWNALAMVVRANRANSEVGGHLASYASGADLFEVGFNHFFRGDASDEQEKTRADLVFFQPHAAPGIYSRAFLEGRLTESQLVHYRREVIGRGLSSYPHPRLMPEFWQFPTGSMGLGVINAVYQARFMRYLQNRSLLEASDRRVWAFIGDGEMDEPESVAGLTLAARDNLDNLTFVVNCNLQRLDGPVRGNGSIVQELERLFSGAGWNVIKVLWGRDWDDLFARDKKNAITRRFEEVVDGELQTYGAMDGRYNREHFFGKNPDLNSLVSHLSDEDISSLTRGGHDPAKIYAAFQAAVNHRGRPSVILAQTKKGYGLGRWGESRMSAHQQKKLDDEALLWFRDRFRLPLSDRDAREATFYRPPSDSCEMRYLQERRQGLGGFIPRRRIAVTRLETPKQTAFADFALNGGTREMSTTVAFVRMLSNLIKDATLQSRLVPIVADEARTFGMQSLFRKIGLYSPCGQLYKPQDSDDLLYYKEAKDGQILEEGITEAGALSSWIAAATSYSNHALPMLPFYIFYSIFGFQRVGDLIWAAADSKARGFLIGATAGRTTLAGEGLQHQDGTSHLIASTIPTCRAFDPCFAYELAVILEHGMRAMLTRQEDVFYYVTVMNESFVHPSMPLGADEGILRGMYRVRESSTKSKSRVQLLGAGTILREALAAADLLERDWDVSADVWSVTSFTELRRDGLEAEHRHRIDPEHDVKFSWVEQCLGGTSGPVIATSDYVRAVPDLIRPWVPRRYLTLGTDGFGRSDTRAALRRFFGIDGTSIAFAAMCALVDDNRVSSLVLAEFRAKYEFTTPSRPSWEM